MKINIIPHRTHAGWYYLVFRPDGIKGKKKYVPAQSYDEAVAARNQLLAAYNVPDREKRSDPRIKDVYQDYLAWCKGEQAPITYTTKRAIMESTIIPFFGEYRVKDLKQTHFDAFQKSLKKKQAAKLIYQNMIMALIHWMIDRNYAKPMDFRPPRPSYNSKRKIIPHPSDLDAVIAHIKSEWRKVMLSLMLLTGLRWNEVRHLEWGNVDLKTGIIRLSESATAEDDFISIPDSLTTWFEANQKKSGWLFPSPKDKTKPVCRIAHAINVAAEKAGVKLTPHILRHACGTYLYEATGDIYAVQNQLRHRRVTTTQIYTQMSTARKRTNQNALEAHLAKLRNS